MSDSNPINDRIFVNLDRIHDKLEVMDARLESIDRTLVSQGKDLEYHINRTNLLEENINILRAEVKPMQKHIVMTEAIFKIFGAISAIVLFAAAVLKTLGVIK